MSFDWKSVGLERLAGDLGPAVMGSFSAWGHLLARTDSPVGLPAFQRSSAWNEPRVELFWDSVSRSYPVGTLLLAETDASLPDHEWADKPLPDGHGGSGTALSDHPHALQVLDGQQRCVALALGFAPWHANASMRLWLDVAALARAEEPEKPARRFHACSWSHPWGRDRDESRASLARQRTARWALGRSPHDASVIALGETFPVHALAPVALASVLDACQGDGVPTLSALLQQVPQAALARPERVQSLSVLEDGERELRAAERREHLELELDAMELERSLRRLKSALDRSLLALIASDLGSGRDLIEAFVRLNRQGVALSEPELFFSGLKHHWPRANNLVLNVQADEAVGHVLPPTSIVHLAVRLSAPKLSRRESEADYPRLTVDLFQRLMRDHETFRMEMQYLLDSGDDGRARITDVMATTRRLLQYRPDDPHDPGLPMPLLADIHWRVWHTIAAWVFGRVGKDHPGQEEQRTDVLRYAFLDHLFVNTTRDSAASKPLVLARQSPDSFPGREIHETLGRRNLIATGSVLHPDEMARRLGAADAEWPLLVHELALVKWGQRAQLQRWFHTWDPFFGRSAEDLPFDVDHIVPSASLNRQGKGKEDLPEALWRDRDAVRDSIGNKRLWPREANRSDGDIAAKVKLFLSLEGSTALTSSEWDPERWGLPTAEDVRRASLIAETDVPAWLAASSVTDDDKDWTSPSRFDAFRAVVDARRGRLYGELYDTLGFDAWQVDQQDASD